MGEVFQWAFMSVAVVAVIVVVWVILEYRRLR